MGLYVDNPLTCGLSLIYSSSDIYVIKLMGFLSLLFAVLHTSASLALNESWDPDVR